MKRTFFAISSVLLTLTIFLLLCSGMMIGIATLSPASGYRTAFTQENGIAKVIFKVKCYDEGKTALQGLKGIQKIDTGFHYIHETDTVYFNPTVITINEMESSLKK